MDLSQEQARKKALYKAKAKAMARAKTQAKSEADIETVIAVGTVSEKSFSLAAGAKRVPLTAPISSTPIVGVISLPMEQPLHLPRPPRPPMERLHLKNM